jgi:hypothetical protein
MLLLVRKANEAETIEISTFDAIFLLSMEICDQYGLGCGPESVIECPIPLTARLAA